MNDDATMRREAFKTVGEWLRYPANVEALKIALRVAKERSEYLKKARQVSFEQLHTVYGPVDG